MRLYRVRSVLVIVLSALLAACAGSQTMGGRSSPGVEVAEPGGSNTASRTTSRQATARSSGSAQQPATVTTYPVPDSSGPSEAIPLPAIDTRPVSSGNSAVNTLLAQAETERQSGNTEAAVAAAERALRIAPGDPSVYLQLATLRLERGELALAEQLARKGLSYQPDPELRQRLTNVIERARQGRTG